MQRVGDLTGGEENKNQEKDRVDSHESSILYINQIEKLRYMSKKQTFTRKKRIAIYAVITIVAVSVAFYNSQINSNFKQSKVWNFDSIQNGTIPQGYEEMSNDQKLHG